MKCGQQRYALRPELFVARGSSFFLWFVASRHCDDQLFLELLN